MRIIILMVLVTFSIASFADERKVEVRKERCEDLLRKY